MSRLFSGWGDAPVDVGVNPTKRLQHMRDLQSAHNARVAAEKERINYNRSEYARQRDMEPVGDIEDLPGGKAAPMTAGIPAGPAESTAAASSGSFTAAPAQTPVRSTQQAQYTRNNVTPQVTTNQGNNESGVLSRSGNPNAYSTGIQSKGAGYAAASPQPANKNIQTRGAAYAAANPQKQGGQTNTTQQQRYDELRAKNFTATTGGNETPAEAKKTWSAGDPTAYDPKKTATPTGQRTPRGEQYATAKTPYDALIAKAAADAGLDPEVFKRLIGTESSFRPDPPVVIGANGQRHLGIAQISDLHGMSDADRRNPEVALPFAARLFAKYLKESNGDYNEALLRYKGATSERGRAAMQGPVQDILSGTRYLNGQTAAPAATQTAGVPGGAPTAQAPAAQPAAQAPAMTFTPEQVTQVAAATDQELRMTKMRLDEINRRLSYAPTAQEAAQLRQQALDLKFGAYGAQLKNAFVQSMGGNPDALTQLATAAGVQYAQTPQGFVAVRLDPAKGQYVAVSQPMPMHVFARDMYDEASGAAERARAAQHAANAKAQGEIAVKNAENQNAMNKTYLEKNLDLRNKLAENRVGEDEITGVTPFNDGRALIRTKRGVIEYIPEQDMGDGVPVPSRLQYMDVQR